MDTTASRALVGVLSVWLLLPTLAHANDSSFGGEGADLAPLVETRVRMKSEDITLTLGEDGLWYVEALYRFENPTGERVALQVGFPERHCDEEGDCMEGGGRFIDLRTEVRGRRVPMRVGRVGEEHEWAPRLGRVFLFDVRFDPHEEVVIEHRYRMHRSTYVETRDEVFYVTRTGALWAGPIEHARFTVRTPYRPGRLAFPEEYRVARYVEHATDAGAVSEIVFEMRDWTPTHDLDLHLSDSYVMSDEVHCPDPSAYGYLRSRLAERISDDERRRLREQLAAEDARARALDPRRRRVCRNLVFAVHGYHFRSDDLTRLFYRPPQRTSDPFGYGDEAGAGAGRERTRYRVMGLTENPEFSQSLLTPLERQYLRWLAP